MMHMESRVLSEKEQKCAELPSKQCPLTAHFRDGQTLGGQHFRQKLSDEPMGYV